MNIKFTVISIIIAVSLVGAAVFLRNNKQSVENKDSTQIVTTEEEKTFLPELGLPGSEHAHISIMLFINDKHIDLSQSKYMLKDQLVHLENNDGVVIHKHTTGITVPYFLSTLGIKLIQSCLILDTGEQYCNSDSGKLSLVVNGKEITDFISYEMKQDDKVVVDYGNSDKTNLQLKLNQIDDLSEDFSRKAR